VIANRSMPASPVIPELAYRDDHYRRAVVHGARTLSPPTDYPFGERQYSVEDPGGHRWVFSQSIADVDPASWGGKLPES
jgi:uncharacterized glyoxalase superfamily protein PhnB